jgi:hypothetical protein
MMTRDRGAIAETAERDRGAVAETAESDRGAIAETAERDRGAVAETQVHDRRPVDLPAHVHVDCAVDAHAADHDAALAAGGGVRRFLIAKQARALSSFFLSSTKKERSKERNPQTVA